MSTDPKTLEVAGAIARLLAPVVAEITQNVITLDYGIPEGRYTITVAQIPYDGRNVVHDMLGDELDNGDGPGGYFYDHMLDR